MMWKPDPIEIERCRATLAAWAEAPDGTEVSTAVTAAGRLHLMGCDDVVRGVVQPRDDLRARVATWFASIDFHGLEAAALDLVLAARAMHDEDSPFIAQRAMDERDRDAVWCAGAATILGDAFVLSLDQEIAIAEFEGVVRPELWRLVAMGRARSQATAWMAPHHRRAFWWWHEGSDVAPAAVEAMAAVAMLVVRFPEARLAFDALVTAQQSLDRARAVAPVVSLGEWVARRLARAGRDTERVAVGFASGEHVPLARLEGVSLSWHAPDVLVLDLEEPAAPTAGPPVLMLANGATRVGVAEPDFVDRYAFRLDDTARTSQAVRLRVELARGVVEFVLADET